MVVSFSQPLMSSVSFGMAASGPFASRTITSVLFTFAGIALYNTLESLVLVFVTFKRYNGLYFWSMLISTIGILPYTLGLLFKFYDVVPANMFVIALVMVGWHTMVTGQSVVMYSRLHLVTSNQKLLKSVLAMIMANWFISNVPITVLVFGANSINPLPFRHIYGIWERVQLCLYFVQESIISFLYITKVAKLLRHDFRRRDSTRAQRRANRTETSRQVLYHLICVNLCIILLDVTLISIEFAGYYYVQVLYKVSLWSQPRASKIWTYHFCDLGCPILYQTQDGDLDSQSIDSPIVAQASPIPSGDNWR